MGRRHCDSKKCVSRRHSARQLTAEHGLRLRVKVQAHPLQRQLGGKSTNRQAWYRMTPPAPGHKRRRGSQSLCWTNCSTQSQSAAPRMTMIVPVHFSEPSVPKEQKPRKRWEGNAAWFPTPAILAEAYLSVHATSTPSERLYSAAVNGAEHVDTLTFPAVSSLTCSRRDTLPEGQKVRVWFKLCSFCYSWTVQFEFDFGFSWTFFILRIFCAGPLLMDHVSASPSPCKCQSLFATPENMGEGRGMEDLIQIAHFWLILNCFGSNDTEDNRLFVNSRKVFW